jgi:hypothetical protein
MDKSKKQSIVKTDRYHEILKGVLSRDEVETILKDSASPENKERVKQEANKAVEESVPSSCRLASSSHAGAPSVCRGSRSSGTMVGWPSMSSGRDFICAQANRSGSGAATGSSWSATFSASPGKVRRNPP